MIDYEVGVTIEDCYFESNVAVSGGGAILIGGSPIGPWVIRDCVFWRNLATSGGSAGGALDVGGSGTVEHNTFAGNSALSVLGGSTAILKAAPIAFVNNVVTGSLGGEAIRRGSGGTVTDGCNVYWNNAGGNTVGFSMAATSRVVDPLYCDAPNGALTVAAGSPCLPPNSAGCGAIGALGEACGAVSVEQRSWGTIKGGYR